MPDHRRNFLVRATYALGALIAGGLGIPALVYLLSPPRVRATAGWVNAFGVDQLKPRVPEEVTFRRVRMDGWRILSEKSTAWVVKLSDAEVVAYAPQCTHLGCAYHFDEAKGQFLCPCHTSFFSIEGQVLGGPAPRPLDRMPVRVDGLRVLIGPPGAAKQGA